MVDLYTLLGLFLHFVAAIGASGTVCRNVLPRHTDRNYPSYRRMFPAYSHLYSRNKCEILREKNEWEINGLYNNL